MLLSKKITVQTIIFITGLFGLIGCGGSETPSYTIETDVDLVEFVSTHNQRTAQSQEVNVTFHGDGVLVGYAPGESEPHWLSVTMLESNSNSARFRLSAHHEPAPGELKPYSANLRFVTGKQDGSVVLYDEVKVTLLIQQGFALANPFQSFTAESSGKSSRGVEINQEEIELLGTVTNWSINKPDWVTVSQESGQGEAKISVGIDPQYANYGFNSGEIKITDAISGESERIRITYQLNSASVIVDNQPHTFSISADTENAELTSIINIQDSLNGESSEDVFSWQLISSSAPWLSLKEGTGTTAIDSSSPQITIDKAELLKRLPGELYEGVITLAVKNEFAATSEYQIVVSAFIQSSPVIVSDSIANEFDFQINDAAFSSAYKTIAVSDTSANKLYLVNAQTGKTVAYYPFDLKPRALSVSPNGKYLYVSLDNEDFPIFYSETNGDLAIIDLQQGRLIQKFTLDFFPWDIEGTDDGLVYVSSGSYYYENNIKRYNALTGILDIEGYSSPRINLALSADQKSVYGVETDVSPEDVVHFSQVVGYDGADVLGGVDSPYHGDYSMGNKLWLDVKNNLIVTQYLNIFNASDLKHHIKPETVNQVAGSVAFDYKNNKVVMTDVDERRYSGIISSLDLPNYDNYQVIATTTQKPVFVFNNDGEYLVIEESDNSFYLMKY